MEINRKIGIVGCGHVGMAAASVLFQKNLANELILIDRNQKLAEGEALDLMHAQGYASRCHVRAGHYSDLHGSSFIVISAGVSQKPGETRIDLLNRNVAVLAPIIEELDIHCPDAIIVMATNPVDIMTYIAQDISKRPQRKIIGTGTMLDTSRFKTIIGQHYKISPASVHAYVLGEHGNSEVLLWSSVTIAGQKVVGQEVLSETISTSKMEEIERDVKMAAYQIIEKKGHTNWAIGHVIGHLVQTLSTDQRAVLPLSIRFDGEYGISGTCLGHPCVVSKDGIEQMVSLKLTEDELEKFRASGKLLADLISEIKK